MALYEHLTRFKPDGTIDGHHARDWNADTGKPGPVRRITQADLDAMDSRLEVGYVQRIAELEAELSALRTAHAAELQAAREAQAAASDGDLAARLAELFRSLPMEVQLAFSGEVVTIMGLLDLGRGDLARGRLNAVQVPEELEATKTALLEAIAEA